MSTALHWMWARSEPYSGSVMHTAMTVSPRTIFGSHFRRCSSVPFSAM